MFAWREKERKTRRKEKEKKIVYKGRKEKGRKEKQRKEKERKEISKFPAPSSEPHARNQNPSFSPIFIFVAFFSSKLVTQGWVSVRTKVSQLHSSSLIRKRRKTVFEIQTQTPPFLLDPSFISRRVRRESCSPPRHGARGPTWRRRCERRFLPDLLAVPETHVKANVKVRAPSKLLACIRDLSVVVWEGIC